MAPRLGALGDDHVSPDLHRRLSLPEISDLDDQGDIGVKHRPREKSGIAEGKHHGVWPVLKGLLDHLDCG